MLLYQYTIPLEETEDGHEPAYEYPEEDEYASYEANGTLIVIHDEVIPQFHRDSVAVGVDIVSKEDVEKGR